MAAGNIKKRATRRGRDRNQTPQRTRVSTPTAVHLVSTSVAGSVLTMTFDQPIVLRGVPRFLVKDEDREQLPTSAAEATPISITLTYPDPVEGTVTVPFGERRVRNRSDGPVVAGTYAIGETYAAAAGEDGEAAGFVGPGPQTEAA